MNIPEKASDFKCVTAFTPTICTLTGARIPAQCQEEPLAAVLEEAQRVLGGEKVEKVMIFAPDAVGCHLWEKYPEQLERTQKIAPVRIPTRVVMPSVTPVCFGSMYSGATPDIHGIQEYAKPVLTVETIFNTLPEAGLKTLISSINNCSIDCIFRRRPVTYCSVGTNPEVLRFTKFALGNPEYDVIVNYAMDYDKMLHAHGPFAQESVDAFNRDVDDFELISNWIDEHWANYNRLLVFCPDHGGHESAPGRGGHGSDADEDMLVYHFYSIRKKA